MSNIIISGQLEYEGQIEKGYIICDESTGIISDVLTGNVKRPDFGGAVYDYDDGAFILPGDINAHSHPEQSIYTDIVDKAWDLPTWCRNTIYKYTPFLKPEHIYFSCCRAFSRMLKYGVTSVLVSYYCHNNKGNEYDRQVIRAALDTGIRLYFGRMNYDIINKDAYEAKRKSQECYYESVNDAEKYFIELLGEFNNNRITIAPSIHSIHASTREAIVNAINLGNKYGKYVQFHLSEDKGDVELSLKLYGMRPVEFLADLLKNGEIESLENLFLSDCVWIDDNERQLISKHNMKVVLNPRMNDRIKTGEADLVKLLENGQHPYLGTDGEASNDDLSIEGERKFLKDRFKNIPESLINGLGTQRLKLGEGFTGKIQKGNYCDLKIIKNNKAEDIFVGGKRIVKCGKLLTLDEDNFIESSLKDIGNNLFK